MDKVILNFSKFTFKEEGGMIEFLSTPIVIIDLFFMVVISLFAVFILRDYRRFR